MSHPLRRSRGVSLVEALVALAVMAFGMLGVVGMQFSMRANADAAKQRAEAVRIAQAAMEDWRTFERLDNPGSGGTVAAFDDISSYSSREVTGYTSNTSYRVSGTALPASVATIDLKLKTVTVAVNWDDRAGQTQGVLLASAIAGIAPELAAATALPGDRSVMQPPSNPRHVAIPPSASASGSGSSSFVPPRTEDLPRDPVWLFNNLTGAFVVCNPGCGTDAFFLLSGYVRFATGAVSAVGLAEHPDLPPSRVRVRVQATAPSAATVDCYTQTLIDAVAYYCAMPVGTSNPRLWSGRSFLRDGSDGSGFHIADNAADASPSHNRVCRYTPELSDTPAGGNAAHPLDYTNVTESLSNQNFLVIKAGDGSSAFPCPTDDPTTSVNGNTFRHQPLV